jgi:sulfate adenylyltransferase
MTEEHLIEPYGGSLVQLLVDDARRIEIQAASRDWPSWSLSPRQICDLELLLNGGFSPLKGFMNRADYESVLGSMSLADGMVWPIPITLDVSEEFARRLELGSTLALRDPEGVMLAALVVEEIWQSDRQAEAESVYATTSPEHPGVSHLLHQTHHYYVGGRLEGVQLPRHYDFRQLRQTPAVLRKEFTRLGWRKVAAFQTRTPMHRAHYEITLRAAKEARANLLIHPVAGMTKPGDLDHYTRVRCYQALLPQYPPSTVKLSLLPLAMRMAGPREGVWHAIVRRNYGCTHLIVGRDHAGPGADSKGKPFYEPYAAQELMQQFEKKIGVHAIPFKTMAYVQDRDAYYTEEKVPEGGRVLSISEPELVDRLADGREIPDWFTFPTVTGELRRTHPPRHSMGFTVFFTGLSGAGKSTIANVLLVKFLEMGGRPVTLLDGDIVRRHLSSELGFSKEHRDINIRRIGFVASEITKNGGIAICAPIAPYDSVRQEVREMIQDRGGFVLVHVATPLEVCEKRDRKGMYAKARAGIIKEFTGISDPYEEPADADVVIDTSDMTPEEASQEVVLYLERRGYIGASR